MSVGNRDGVTGEFALNMMKIVVFNLYAVGSHLDGGVGKPGDFAIINDAVVSCHQDAKGNVFTVAVVFSIRPLYHQTGKTGAFA